jgi:hypothetical protein
MRTVRLELLAGVAAIAIGLLLPLSLHADPADGSPPPGRGDLFDQIDTNHDGFISHDELLAFEQKRTAARVDKMYDRMDANHDGKVTKAEYDAAIAQMRDRMGGHKHRHDGPPPDAPAGDTE